MFKINFKKIFKKLSNPLLFYVDKSGNSVFRNFCIAKKDGYLYPQAYTMPEVGKFLEYRIELNKKLRTFAWAITFLVYILLIKTNISILSIILYEILWVVLYFGARAVCANLYGKFLLKNLGAYSLVEFEPELSQKKKRDFKYSFYSKITRYIIIFVLFFIPAFIMSGLVKFSVSAKKPHFKSAITITKIYSFIYPKTQKIYDMEAYAKYMTEDYEGALADYKTALKKGGTKFDKHDYARFANLLLLEKKIYGSQSAIDLFNEYITNKRPSIMDQTKMLWMKSMFSIKNNVSEFVIQDYDDLLASLNPKDDKNMFYISCDKAYMLYLTRRYKEAIALYDVLIPYALEHKDMFSQELKSLYAERGFAKRQLGDNISANADFLSSKINMYEIDSYEPKVSGQGFMVDKF